MKYDDLVAEAKRWLNEPDSIEEWHPNDMIERLATAMAAIEEINS